MSFGTGAGKGSLPRKVDTAKYANNYENIFSKKDPVAADVAADDDTLTPKSERQVIADAQRERLNYGLETMASWCASRASGEHDIQTTLTMLEKKAAELRGKVMEAGWVAANDYA